LRFENVTALTDGYVQFAGLKLEQGSIATDWTPAPEDKVNVSDMRKPASDVAGIEEVNAKQDKIGYTPADDSKVVHSTLTQLNSTDMNTVLTAGFYRSFNGTNGIPSGDNWTIYQIIPLSDDSANGVQLAYETNSTVLGLHSWKSKFWCWPAGTGSARGAGWPVLMICGQHNTWEDKRCQHCRVHAGAWGSW